jgi:hypothetical protein
MSTSITISDTILRTRSRPGQVPGRPARLSRPRFVRHRARVASDDYSMLRSRPRSVLKRKGQTPPYFYNSREDL